MELITVLSGFIIELTDGETVKHTTTIHFSILWISLIAENVTLIEKRMVTPFLLIRTNSIDSLT